MKSTNTLAAKLFTAVCVLVISTEIRAQVPPENLNFNTIESRLQSPDEKIRVQAAKQIKGNGDFVLIEMALSDFSVKVRTQAMTALTATTTPQTLDLAERAYVNDPSVKIKAAALQILSREPSELFYQRVESLILEKDAKLREKNAALQEAAIRSLNHKNNDKSRKLLQTAMGFSYNQNLIKAAAETMFTTFGVNDMIYHLNNTTTFAERPYTQKGGEISADSKTIIAAVFAKATPDERVLLEDRIRFQVPLAKMLGTKIMCKKLFMRPEVFW